MGLTQALSAALAGIHVTQQGLSVIAGNVANANTPGYVDETVKPVEVAAGGSGGSASIRAASTAISIRCCRASCGPKPPAAPMPIPRRSSISSCSRSTARRDRRRRSTRSTIISPTALQALSTSPSSYSSQTAVIGAAQALAQNLNSMTTSIQQLRTPGRGRHLRRRADRQTALAQIAKINPQLEDGASPTPRPRRSRISATRTSRSSRS